MKREKKEDEARDHLPCCCFTKVFDFLIVGNRAELTDPHRGGKKWLIYILMSLYIGISTFYIILWGFCHGQATTLDWLWGLLQQTLLSAFFVRPMQIYVFSGLLPGMILQLGLCFKYRKKRKLKAEKIHRKTQEQKKVIELVELNDMLMNPMLSSGKKTKKVLDINGNEKGDHSSSKGEEKIEIIQQSAAGKKSTAEEEKKTTPTAGDNKKK